MNLKTFTLDQFFGMDSVTQTAQLYDNLTQELFTVQDTGLTYQVIKFWDAQGLLLSQRDKTSKWRKFSFLDYIWIRVMDELRVLGIPVKLIKEVKSGLFENISIQSIYQALSNQPELVNKLNMSEEEKADLKKFLKSKKFEKLNKSEGYSYFLLMLVESITRKAPISILVFTDGSWLPWSEDKIQIYTKETIEKKTFQTHVVISLSNILKTFLTDEKSTFVLPKLNLLEANELKILEIISSGEYESITINFKNKKIKSVQMVKEQDVKKRIVDILSENSYQDITIKSHKGMITKIQNTVKVLFE